MLSAINASSKAFSNYINTLVFSININISLDWYMSFIIHVLRSNSIKWTFSLSVGGVFLRTAKIAFVIQFFVAGIAEFQVVCLSWFPFLRIVRNNIILSNCLRLISLLVQRFTAVGLNNSWLCLSVLIRNRAAAGHLSCFSEILRKNRNLVCLLSHGLRHLVLSGDKR